MQPQMMQPVAQQPLPPQQMMPPVPLGGGDQNNAQLAQMHQMVQHAVHQIAARMPPPVMPMMAGQMASVGAMQGSPQMSVAAQQMAQQFGAMQMAGSPMGAMGMPGLPHGQMHPQHMQMQQMIAMHQMQAMHHMQQMQQSPMGAHLAGLQMGRQGLMGPHSSQRLQAQPGWGGTAAADGMNGGGGGGGGGGASSGDYEGADGGYAQATEASAQGGAAGEPFVPAQQQAVGQVEFYFSDANLATDAFMRDQISADPSGFVDLVLINGFHNMQPLRLSIPQLAQALMQSPFLELDANGLRVRLRPSPSGGYPMQGAHTAAEGGESADADDGRYLLDQSRMHRLGLQGVLPPGGIGPGGGGMPMMHGGPFVPHGGPGGPAMHPRGRHQRGGQQPHPHSPSGGRAGRAGAGQTEEQRLLYYLNLGDVRSGADKRTTLMIRNIPNKYSQKMLLEAIEQNHRGNFDLLYLPIDFRNKCNVGYAFVNFISTSHIPAFYEEFNFRQWDRFNSNKVCEITYARIQSKVALIKHFENSALAKEDEAYQPVVFASDGSGRRENLALSAAAAHAPPPTSQAFHSRRAPEPPAGPSPPQPPRDEPSQPAPPKPAPPPDSEATEATGTTEREPQKPQPQPQPPAEPEQTSPKTQPQPPAEPPAKPEPASADKQQEAPPAEAQ